MVSNQWGEDLEEDLNWDLNLLEEDQEPEEEDKEAEKLRAIEIRELNEHPREFWLKKLF